MVQHTHTAEMDQEYAAFKDAFVRSLLLEERLSGLSPEERLAGMSAEDVFEALTPEQRVHLLNLLKGGRPSESEE